MGQEADGGSGGRRWVRRQTVGQEADGRKQEHEKTKHSIMSRVGWEKAAVHASRGPAPASCRLPPGACASGAPLTIADSKLRILRAGRINIFGDK